MALAETSLPFGCRDIKLKVLDAAGAPGTAVDLPNGRTLSFSEAEDFETLRGDDADVAVHGKGPGVDWSLEGGGISFNAVKALYGGTITETGVSPATIRTFAKLATDQRPYLQIEGQAISDSGGDFHVVLYKCRCTGELSGSMEDGSYWITGASGRAIGRASDGKIYSFVMNETAAAIV